MRWSLCMPLKHTWLSDHIFDYYQGRKEMFYLTTHSTHFIYCYMASDICLRTILIMREETRCRHTGYSFQLAARVLLYAPSHRQDSTYHGLCYTSRGALTVTRNSSMGWLLWEDCCVVVPYQQTCILVCSPFNMHSYLSFISGCLVCGMTGLTIVW